MPQISTLDGHLVTIAEYNKIHDEDGKFGHGSNSSPGGAMTGAEMDKQFGTDDPYVYHLDATRASPILFEAGIKPSKRGISGAGVYLANTPGNTQYNATLKEGILYRVKKRDLIKKFGLYSSSKTGPNYKPNGIQFDDHEGELFIEGKRKVPGKFLQIKDYDTWRNLTTWKSVAEMTTVTGEKVVVAEYNKIHESDGRFGHGNNPGGKSDKPGKSKGGAGPVGADEAAEALLELDGKAGNINTFAKLKKHNQKLKAIVDKYYEDNGASDQLYGMHGVQALTEQWTGTRDGGIASYEKEIMKLNSGKPSKLDLDYALTQAFYKKQGITELVLERGVTGKQANELRKVMGTSSKFKVADDPAASWTDAHNIAANFAGDKGILIKRKIPVANIVHTYKTNFDLARFGENELVITDPKGYTGTGKDISDGS